MVRKREELFNVYSHLFGSIAGLAGTVLLIILAAHSTPHLLVVLIYGLSVVFMFSASTLHHTFKISENDNNLWHRMDRLAIYFMIAGTYTPVCFFYLDGPWRWSMIGIQWGLVLFGFVSQVCFPGASRVLYSAIYLVMGWLAILPLHRLFASMTLAELSLLVAGGIFFTIGGIVYAIKRPLLFPGRFSFHELFHVLILFGFACHFLLIYRAVDVAM
ncbi:MAG TPA: hemolysin III family protein [Geopsychrobacteraceae bacterium]|nr:hemolysin III family protein [Geopsychrobacteraceae bacterium]